MAVDPKTLHLPTQPGVYLFKTDNGRVLYVGKATHLKDRVRSYFAKNPDHEMIPTLVAKADLVDCIVHSRAHRRCASACSGTHPPAIKPAGQAPVLQLLEQVFFYHPSL